MPATTLSYAVGDSTLQTDTDASLAKVFKVDGTTALSICPAVVLSLTTSTDTPVDSSVFTFVASGSSSRLDTQTADFAKVGSYSFKLRAKFDDASYPNMMGS